MYIARGSPYAHHLLKIRGPAHKVNELDGCQNIRMRAALTVSMEKNKKTSVSKDHLYTKSKKKNGWRLFYSQLPWLPTATDPCHERSM